MKNFTFLFFAALVSVNLVSAQTTFSVTPNPSVVSAPPEIFDATAHATIKNISNVRDSIVWVRTEIELPKNFTTAVCDCTQCYKEEVSSMSFGINPNESCVLDVHFYNNLETSGTGIVHLKVTNVNVPSDMITAVYLYNTTSSAKDPLPAATVRVFPNPVTEGFALENADDVAGVRIYSLQGGRQVANFEPSADQRYSVTNQPAGTYIVALVAKNGKVFQAVEVQKQ